MTDRIRRLALPSLLGIALVASGCVSVRELVGFPAESTPSVNIQRSTQYWVLIKNPRYGDVPSEPEYVWVEEDKIPTTVRTLMFGKGSILAPPEIVAKYGSPPGGGRISPRQGAPYTATGPGQVTRVVSQSASPQEAGKGWVLIKNPRYGDLPGEPEYVWVEEDKIPTTFQTLLFGKTSSIAPPEVVAKYGPPPRGGRIGSLQGVAATSAASANVQGSVSSPVEVTTRRGYVVYVDTTRVVVDLTAKDGVRPGTLVSLRRDKVQIIHPVTGELLGELDEEVGTAKVVEVREKFSVAEIQALTPGSQIKLKDRVVIR